MQTIRSAFHEEPAAARAGASAQPSSKNAYFVFAAANRNELQGAKQQLDGWGAQDGWDWRPYFPTAPQSVGALAQLAAANKNLRFQELSCDTGLPQRLKDVKGVNAPVVIFTDPWTATLPTYRKVLEEYDLLNLTNCALLVPWNDTDSETAKSKPTLEKNLWAACGQKYRYKYPGHYWQIRSSEELRDRALGVLDEITLRILDQADHGEVRKAESAELANAAAAEGIPTEAPSQLVNVAPEPASVEAGALDQDLDEEDLP
jgi:FxsC-like protein